MPADWTSLLCKGAKVLHRQGALVALEKPEGVRSHPNEGGRVDRGALIAAPYDLEREIYRLPGGGALHLLHRLDGPTSGLILVCEDAALAAAVRGLFSKHQVKKTYEALVFGKAGRAAGLWRDRLRTDRAHGAARTGAGSGAMAEAQAKLLGTGDVKGLPLSHLSLEPATGRTHQLRVQCAERNLPIGGDATYGNFPWNRRAAKDLGIKRLCLHAARVRFDYELDGRKLSFEARCPAPEEFSIVG
jgi:23S rRNA-/tRNA-specific pseudouridylate synthase